MLLTLLLAASVFSWEEVKGFCAALVILGGAVVFYKNTRAEIVIPFYNFWVKPLISRRRKINLLIEFCDQLGKPGEFVGKVDQLASSVGEILHEVKPNSGGSIKDQVTRIERNQHYLHGKMLYADHISTKYLFETDPAGSVTKVNRALCDLLNREPAELLGRAWINSLEPTIRERVKNEWRDAITNKIPLESVQLVIDGVTKEIFEVRVHASPHLNADGEIENFFGNVHESRC